MDNKNLFKDIKKVVNNLKRFNNKFLIYMVMNEYNKLYKINEIIDEELNNKLYTLLIDDIKLNKNDIKKNIKFIKIKEPEIKGTSEEQTKKKGRKKIFSQSYYERHKEDIRKKNLERYYYNKSKETPPKNE